MFYRPRRDVWTDGRYSKTNLAKTPKIYHCHPSAGMLSGSFYSHLAGTRNLLSFLPPEWAIESLQSGEWVEIGDLT